MRDSGLQEKEPSPFETGSPKEGPDESPPQDEGVWSVGGDDAKGPVPEASPASVRIMLEVAPPVIDLSDDEEPLGISS